MYNHNLVVTMKDWDVRKIRGRVNYIMHRIPRFLHATILILRNKTGTAIFSMNFSTI